MSESATSAMVDDVTSTGDLAHYVLDNLFELFCIESLSDVDCGNNHSVFEYRP